MLILCKYKGFFYDFFYDAFFEGSVNTEKEVKRDPEESTKNTPTKENSKVVLLGMTLFLE